MQSPLAKKNLASNLMRMGVGGRLNTSVPPCYKNHCSLVTEAGGDEVGWEKCGMHAQVCANRHYYLQEESEEQLHL